MTTEAEQKAPLWRFQSRLLEWHAGCTAEEWSIGLGPFNHYHVFEVLQEIAYIEGRITWDGQGRTTDDRS